MNIDDIEYVQTHEVWQEPNNDVVVYPKFKKNSDGKYVCNNKQCEKCYPRPEIKEKKRKTPLRCIFGFHELHHWYVSKFSICRLCGLQKETYY